MSAKTGRTVFTRRRVLQAGGVAVAAATAGITVPALASETQEAELEELGPGVFTHPIMSGLMVGETMYVGSRYLTPTRVTGLHIPSGQATTFEMGNGLYVEGLAYDGDNGLYAGVTNAEDDINLYRIDLDSAEVSEAAAIPGLSIRDVTVAPDGEVFVVGTPSPSSGPQLFAYNPDSGEVRDLLIPEPAADQGTGVSASESTIYFACNSPRSPEEGRGLYQIDRPSSEITRVRENFGGLTILDDIVVAGDGFAKLDSTDWQDLGFNVSAFARDGDTLYGCAGDGTLFVLDLESMEVSEPDPVSFGTSWGILGFLEGQLVGALDRGLVWTRDMDSGDEAGYDLLEAGAEGGPEKPQSIAAGASGVYVAGNRAVAWHNLDDDSVTNLDLPGEAKDMTVVDEVAYFAVYSSHGLWEHRPGEDPQQVAEFPEEQNRPEVVRYDADNGLVCVGIKADKTDGGGLALYDPDSQEVEVFTDPLGPDESISAIAAAEGLIYLGGARESRNAGDVAAWDPAVSELVWRLPTPLDEAIGSLVVVNGLLCGVTMRGPTFFAIDLSADDPAIDHTADLGDVSAENPALTVANGVIYGAAAQRSERDGSLFRIDPANDFEVTMLVDELGGEWFGRQSIDTGPEDELYTLSGYDLARVRDTDPPE